jgi:hypothetical protein
MVIGGPLFSPEGSAAAADYLVSSNNIALNASIEVI